MHARQSAGDLSHSRWLEATLPLAAVALARDLPRAPAFTVAVARTHAKRGTARIGLDTYFDFIVGKF